MGEDEKRKAQAAVGDDTSYVFGEDEIREMEAGYGPRATGVLVRSGNGKVNLGADDAKTAAGRAVGKAQGELRSGELRSGELRSGGQRRTEAAGDGDGLDYITNRMKRQIEERERRRAELEDEESRARRNRFPSAVGDILGAMHRAYSHARGTQPMALQSASAKATERYERAKAARQANEDAIYNYATGLHRLRRDEHQMKMQEEREERQRQAGDARAEYYRAMSEANRLKAESSSTLNDAKAAELDAKVAYWNRKAECLANGFSTEMAEKEARAERNRAMAAYYNRKPAEGSGGRTGSGMGGYVKEEKTVVERDPMGRETGRTKTTTRTPSGGSSGSGSGSAGGGKTGSGGGKGSGGGSSSGKGSGSAGGGSSSGKTGGSGGGNGKKESKDNMVNKF